jgi:hypothetical protein
MLNTSSAANYDRREAVLQANCKLARSRPIYAIRPAKFTERCREVFICVLFVL